MRSSLARPLLALAILSLAACPGPKPGPDPRTGPGPEPRPAGNVVADLIKVPRVVKIGALYYRQGGGGGVSPVKITVGPNDDKVAEVGVRERMDGI